ncbi:MAG: hypothetical protein J1D86_07730 [Alistipes sp.]|nr:hypothetical protein [Alistipes sp.]
MRLRSLAITVAAATLFASGLVMQTGYGRLRAQEPDSVHRSESLRRSRSDRSSQPDTAVVFMKADWITRRQIDTARVTCFVGNFAAHHNGTLIIADSAVRYSDSYVECFGNVLINKNTTYIYGDRADYDSNTETARVYAPIVKTVDGDAVLYTYNFSFDTRDNIGTYYGGGMVVDRQNKLESERGYYYADTHEVICVERVEIETETYQMKGDSVIYNIETENAEFFEHSNIWNDKDEYLYADRGEYIRSDDLYKVTSNGYLLSEKYELWSDSIDYRRSDDFAILRRNIQLDDTEHMTLGFGDYGEYRGERGDAFLTRRPSIVYYDTSQSDTLYMCSDSMFVYTIHLDADGNPIELPAAEQNDLADGQQSAVADEAADSAAPAADSAAARQRIRPTIPDGIEMPALPAGRERPQRTPRREIETDSLGDNLLIDDRAGTDSEADAEPLRDTLQADSLSMSGSADSLAADSLIHIPTAAEMKQARREEAARIKAEQKKAKQQARNQRLNRIAAERRAKLLEMKERDEAAELKRRIKLMEQSRLRLEKQNAKRIKKGLPPIADTITMLMDSMVAADSAARAERAERIARAADTTALQPAMPTIEEEGLNAADSTAADSMAADTVLRDSIYRLVKCYRDVRIYRTDFQARCDSLVGFTSDSTVHMYIRPVLWSDENQIVSEVMDIFTARSMITRADFVGKPMMSAEIDTACYNQITGKTMTALFDEQGNIYRNDVNGNVQTVYYIQDSEYGDITDVLYLTAGEATYYISGRQIETITYRTDAEGKLSPMDMVPEDQITRLPDFEWRGSERPLRDSVFNRTIRPSQRQQTGELPRPRFPISAAIEAAKARLIARGEWLDRVDVPSQEDEEWRRETLAAPYR